MPFVAMDRNTGARIDITRCENPRLQLVAEDMICPVCSSPMVIVAGQIRVAHFRHKAIEDCPYTEYAGGESEEHRLAKLWLREHLLKESGYGVPVELEYHFSEVGRIADVAQIFPNGWVIVHEIQLASITTERLEQRSRDYLEAGCDVIWYLGKNADTKTNQQWADQYQGFVAQLSFGVENATTFPYSYHNDRRGNILREQNGHEHEDDLSIFLDNPFSHSKGASVLPNKPSRVQNGCDA